VFWSKNIENGSSLPRKSSYCTVLCGGDCSDRRKASREAVQASAGAVFCADIW